VAGGVLLISNQVCSQKRAKSIGFGPKKKAFALITDGFY
jgi:hypothetical protein